MKGFNAVIFPHCYISSANIKKAVSHFGTIAICLPWFMDYPPEDCTKEFESSVFFLRPASRLRPQDNFIRLLSEYKQWMRYHQDDAYTALIRTTQEKQDSERELWEIRQFIRRMGKDISEPDDSMGFKWHMILHLAKEIEENTAGAEEILNRLKLQKPLLEAALEEGLSPDNVLKDLPNKSNAYTDQHLRMIVDAWVGLFGKYLKECEILVTFMPGVMDYVNSVFEDDAGMALTIVETADMPDIDVRQGSMVSQRIPKLADNKKQDMASPLEMLSGKTLVLLKD